MVEMSTAERRKRGIGMSGPSRAARKERETLLMADAEATLAAICDEAADGLGLYGWCRKHDVRFRVMRDWLMADPERARQFEAVGVTRAAIAAESVEAIGRKLIAPDVRTGLDWVDDGPPELDPKAARVAADCLKWSAGVNDRGRFGKQVQHNHTHRMQADHLMALRQASGGGGRTSTHLSGQVQQAPASAQHPIEAEFRLLEQKCVEPLQPVDSMREALARPFRT